MHIWWIYVSSVFLVVICYLYTHDFPVCCITYDEYSCLDWNWRKQDDFDYEANYNLASTPLMMTGLPDKPLILPVGQLAITALDAGQQEDIVTRVVDQFCRPLRRFPALRRLIESILGAPIKAGRQGGYWRCVSLCFHRAADQSTTLSISLSLSRFSSAGTKIYSSFSSRCYSALSSSPRDVVFTTSTAQFFERRPLSRQTPACRQTPASVEITAHLPVDTQPQICSALHGGYSKWPASCVAITHQIQTTTVWLKCQTYKENSMVTGKDADDISVRNKESGRQKTDV